MVQKYDSRSRALRASRGYERLNIVRLEGITDAQHAAVLALLPCEVVM